MQKVKLSIDCSDHNASFVLTNKNNTLLSSLVSNSSDKLLSQILPGTLKEINLTLSDIDMIAWGQGPGSFTGIRICAAWLQSIVYIHNNIEVISVCSLRARTQNYIEQNNITNGAFSTFLSANRYYAYFGEWVIKDGFVTTPKQPVKVVNKDVLGKEDIDLKSYEANALNINNISKSLENDPDYIVSAFEIRPNYLFDHFN